MGFRRTLTRYLETGKNRRIPRLAILEVTRASWLSRGMMHARYSPLP